MPEYALTSRSLTRDIALNHLFGEALLAREVMVKRPLRNTSFLENLQKSTGLVALLLHETKAHINQMFPGIRSLQSRFNVRHTSLE